MDEFMHSLLDSKSCNKPTLVLDNAGIRWPIQHHSRVEEESKRRWNSETPNPPAKNSEWHILERWSDSSEQINDLSPPRAPKRTVSDCSPLVNVREEMIAKPSRDNPDVDRPEINSLEEALSERLPLEHLEINILSCKSNITYLPHDADRLFSDVRQATPSSHDHACRRRISTLRRSCFL